jgi:hypothetical protein
VEGVGEAEATWGYYKPCSSHTCFPPFSVIASYQCGNIGRWWPGRGWQRPRMVELALSPPPGCGYPGNFPVLSLWDFTLLTVKS